MKSCSLLVLVLVATAARADNKEMDRFKGTWALEKFETSYAPALPQSEVEKVRAAFDGNKLTMTLESMTISEATFKLDPSKKPGHIDVTPTTGPNKGKVSLGIYAFEGDKLKLCVASPGEKRPTDFKVDKALKAGLLILKREKK